MRRPIMTAATLVMAIAGASCTPAFNWRETPVAATPLTVLFPCRPESDKRTVQMGGLDVELHMQHCDTHGVTAAVGHATVRDPALVGPVLAQWRQATLAGIRFERTTESPWRMERATPLPQALAVDAAGSDAKGRPLVLKAAWFTRDGEVYAAILYGQAISPEVAETYFSGLRFR